MQEGESHHIIRVGAGAETDGKSRRLYNDGEAECGSRSDESELVTVMPQSQVTEQMLYWSPIVIDIDETAPYDTHFSIAPDLTTERYLETISLILRINILMWRNHTTSQARHLPKTVAGTAIVHTGVAPRCAPAGSWNAIFKQISIHTDASSSPLNFRGYVETITVQAPFWGAVRGVCK